MRRLIIALCLMLAATLLAGACSVAATPETTMSSVVATTATHSTAMTTATSAPPSPTCEPAVSREQAIALAAQNMPANLIAESSISAQLVLNSYSVYVWQVAFEGFSAAEDEIMEAGWEPGNYTIFPDYPGAEYHYAYFNIDAETGKLLIKAVEVLPGALSPDTTSVVWIPSEKPIEVLSVVGQIPEPYNPGGPTITVSLKNVSDKLIVSLNVELGITTTKAMPFIVVFNVSVSSPFVPGATLSAMRLTNGGIGYTDGQYYPVFISGSFQDGTTFSYTQYIQLPKHATTMP